MNWLINHFENNLELPGQIIEAIKGFDVKNSTLTAVLAEITTDVPMTYSRAILYDAIKMSYAGGNYRIEEKQMVHKAAKFMGLDTGVVHSIEVLVDIERSIRDARVTLLKPADISEICTDKSASLLRDEFQGDDNLRCRLYAL